MAKNYFRAASIVLLFSLAQACSKEKYEARTPVYLSIPDIFLDTDYASQGTSSSKITTVWIYANDTAVGTFALPCTVPVLLNKGSNEITLYPGINLNGASASRAIYEGFNKMVFSVDFAGNEGGAADTILVNKSQRTTSYTSSVEIDLVENFDQAGLNLEATAKSDTSIFKINDPAEVFKNESNPTEDNRQAGVFYTDAAHDFVEISTVDGYDLPTFGGNAYVELNYKCNIPFLVGVFFDDQGSTFQRPVVLVNPKEDWNKIYINLVTELSARPGATNIKLFFGAQHDPSIADTGKVFLDNLKLVY